MHTKFRTLLNHHWYLCTLWYGTPDGTVCYSCKFRISASKNGARKDVFLPPKIFAAMDVSSGRYPVPHAKVLVLNLKSTTTESTFTLKYTKNQKKNMGITRTQIYTLCVPWASPQFEVNFYLK